MHSYPSQVHYNEKTKSVLPNSKLCLKSSRFERGFFFAPSALWVKVLSYRVEKSVVSSFRGFLRASWSSFVRDWANKNGWYFPCDSRGPQKVFQEPRRPIIDNRCSCMTTKETTTSQFTLTKKESGVESLRDQNDDLSSL